MSDALYHIAVRMTMANQVSPVLHAIYRDLLHLGTGFTHVNAHLNRFRVALVGAGAAFAGTAILKDMGHLVGHGAELLRIQNQMTAAGYSQKELAEATAKAWELSAKYQSVGVEKILEMQKEMSPVLGDRHEATAIAEHMTQLEVAMESVLGHASAGVLSGQIMSSIRAGELKGIAQNHEKFSAFIETMSQALVAFGGTVKPNDFMQAIKYGRAAAMMWSPEFTRNYLPTIIQELGGSSTGTAFMSLHQAIVGGMMRNRSIEMFDQYGLINRDKLGPQDITPEGRVKRLKPGSFVGGELLMENPYRWVHEHLLPSLISGGLITQEGLDEVWKGNFDQGLGKETRQKMVEMLTLMFQNRTAQGLVELLALQKPKLDRDSRLIGQAMGATGTAEQMLEKDYTTNLKAFHEQWNNLLISLGSPLVSSAVNGLKAINGAITGLVGLSNANPETVRALAVGISATLAAAVVAGISMLTVAALGWPALIGAAIIGGLTGAATYIWANRAWVVSLAAKIGEGLMSIPGMVMGAIASMAAGIANAIKGVFSGLGSQAPGSHVTPAPMAPDGGMGGVLPQRWAPPPRAPGAQQTRVQINLDGYRLGEAVAYHIARGNAHVAAAAQFDGGAMHMPVDLQTA